MNKLNTVKGFFGINAAQIPYLTFIFLTGAIWSIALPTYAQHQVSGTVSDASNSEALPGVNIIVQGTTTGTTTDNDGQYSIDVPSLDETLIFSFIGYITQEIPINGRTTIDIELIESPLALDELVVVGYGTARSTEVTGSVATVDVERIASRPVGNPTQLLQGLVPGMFVTQSTGTPGAESNVLIRGLGTMNNNSPMFIIDGMEGSLDDVNPNDIASISVLKDASSAAIYGTRAANGVILIETKRGRAGAPEATYSTYVGWQSPTRLADYLPSWEYAELINEADVNEGRSPRYTQDEINLFSTGDDPWNYPNTDWIDLALQGSGFTQNHDLRFSGGVSDTRYSISMGYIEEYGLVKNDDSDRANLRVNLDTRVNDWFEVGLNAALSHWNTSSSGISWTSVHRIPPTFLNKYEDGSWAHYLGSNPIASVEDGGTNVTTRNRIAGSLFLESQFSESISFRVRGGLDYWVRDQKNHRKEIYFGDGTVSGPNSITETLRRGEAIDMDAILRYENQFGAHRLSGLLGVQQRNTLTKLTSASRENFPSNLLTALDAGSTDAWSNRGTDVETKLGSYFGRINYNYDDRYLFEANLRRDGSSKFAQGNRWGWFPSFSAGWILTGESFMQNIDMLDFFRMRASWGQLGNHSIEDYLYLERIGLGEGYPFGGRFYQGAAATGSVTPDISWERSTEWNIGLDITLFDALFSVTADYYNRFTDQILTDIPVSAVYGAPDPVVNAGAMRNKGIEVELRHFNQFGNFMYNIGFNATYNKNMVERYPNPDIGSRIRMEGYPWNARYGYEWIGYFMSDEEAANSPTHHPNVRGGDLKFRDQNGDGVIDADDRVLLGSEIPEILFGLDFDFNYRGFDFRTFFQGVERVVVTFGERVMWPFLNDGKPHRMHLDRMIVEDGQVVQEGHFPRTLIGGAHNRTPFNSFWIQDGAYLRLKNLQVGYTISPPETWSFFSNARVYFSGQNLFTLTKKDFPDFADPENPNAASQYPQVKTYTVGLDVRF